MEPDKRAIPNSLEVFFKDGTATNKRAIKYPLGHRRRRAEAIPLLIAKLGEFGLPVFRRQDRGHD